MSEVLKQKIRKDLSRWSRKLLLTIGLENIGKELVGEEKWKNAYPHWKEEDEEERTLDFDPSEVTSEQELTSTELSHVDPSETPEAEEEPNEEKPDILENFFHILPYWYILNRAFGLPNRAGGGGGGGLGIPQEEDLNNSNSNSQIIDAFDAQRLNSLLFFESLKQQLQTQQQSGAINENPFNILQNLPYFSSAGNDIESVAKSLRDRGDATGAQFTENLPLTLPGLLSSNQNECDQPLDLTQKNKKSVDQETKEGGGRRSLASTEVSSSSARGGVKWTGEQARIHKASPRPSKAGRGYTTEELEAALRDIQSGKLGTRRAAVIYGIPRSTLRNKVYKMGKDRSRTNTNNFIKPVAATASPLPPPPPLLSHPVAHNKCSSNEEVEDENRALSYPVPKDNKDSSRPHLNNEEDNNDKKMISISNSNFKKCPPGPGSGEMFGRMLIGGKNNENESDEDNSENGLKNEEDISHDKKVLKEWLRSKLSRQGEVGVGGGGDNLVGVGVGVDPMSDSSDNSDLSSKQTNLKRDVILKIPSLMNNNNKSSSSLMSRVISRKKLKRGRNALEDSSDISTNIPNSNSNSRYFPLSYSSEYGDKSKEEDAEEDNFESLENKKAKLEMENGNELDDENLAIEYRNHLKGKASLSYEDMGNQSSSGFNRNIPSPGQMGQNSDSNGKKSRPKRGKYRNYDRDALLKAVKAVQNGEMSVHRAGSFYGVPHSTLEYKVKERHLLRRPKRKIITGDTELLKVNHKSSPESSLSGSDSRIQFSSSTAAVAALSRQNEGSNHNHSMPLTADLRESLCRYLNFGHLTSGVGEVGDTIGKCVPSSTPSPESSSSNKKRSGSGVETRLGQNELENNNQGLGRSLNNNSYLNLIHLDDIIRHNLENNSLLDLTKKS